MKGTNDLYEVLSASQQKDSQSLASLKELYRVMNVPNLKDRTPEYQKMVKAIGQVSSKEKISAEDKILVINAVKNYASKKKVVPNSESGKKSLNFGYMAIKAVTASDASQEKFIRPMESNITRLQSRMLRDNLINEDTMIKLPQRGGNNIVNEQLQNQVPLI